MALIVFPYVSRVLGPSNFGAVNFIDATADNFIILATMGMTTLGVRGNCHKPQQSDCAFSHFQQSVFTEYHIYRRRIGSDDVCLFVPAQSFLLPGDDAGGMRKGHLLIFAD